MTWRVLTRSNVSCLYPNEAHDIHFKETLSQPGRLIRVFGYHIVRYLILLQAALDLVPPAVCELGFGVFAGTS